MDLMAESDEYDSESEQEIELVKPQIKEEKQKKNHLKINSTSIQHKLLTVLNCPLRDGLKLSKTATSNSSMRWT